MVLFPRALISCGVMMMVTAPISSFVIVPPSTTEAALSFVANNRLCKDAFSKTSLAAYGKYGDGRSSSRYGTKERSKRQERVGHVVRTELAQIIHRGYPVKRAGPIEDELLKRINIVNVDCSPDLRNARVTISVTGTGSDRSVTVDKRRAYSWLVRHSKQIRHALAQRLSHMKALPDLTFVQVDVGAAVDVMDLIEKVTEGYKRENVGIFGGDDDTLPRGMTLEPDFDEDENDGWIDFDDDDEDDEEYDDQDGDEVEGNLEDKK